MAIIVEMMYMTRCRRFSAEIAGFTFPLIRFNTIQFNAVSYAVGIDYSSQFNHVTHNECHECRLLFFFSRRRHLLFLTRSPIVLIFNFINVYCQTIVTTLRY